jgi:hypothetical protein
MTHADLTAGVVHVDGGVVVSCNTARRIPFTING